MYQWKIQQEHCLKALNGGNGMTDEQLARCVQRTTGREIKLS